MQRVLAGNTAHKNIGLKRSDSFEAVATLVTLVYEQVAYLDFFDRTKLFKFLFVENR